VDSISGKTSGALANLLEPMNQDSENQIGRRVFIKRTAGTALAFGAASIILTNRSLAVSAGISGTFEGSTPQASGWFTISIPPWFSGGAKGSLPFFSGKGSAKAEYP
jgi:hypothetical protein